MGDHTRRAGRTPPSWRDHANWNAMQVSVCFASFACGVAMLLDMLWDLGGWVASWSLDLTTDLSQISTAVLLIAGGFFAGCGIVVRPKRWKPLTSVVLEALGWLGLTWGWVSTVIAVVAHGHSGVTITVITFTGFALGSAWECYLLSRLAWDSLEQVRRERQTKENIREIRGEAQ